MRFGRYILYCFLRGHSWVDEEGSAFEVNICEGRDHWTVKSKMECCNYGYGHPHKDIETHKGSYSKDQDRVCADCEKVELNRTDPTNARELAAEVLKVQKEEAVKALQMQMKAARAGPHERALTPEEEKLVNDFMKEEYDRIGKLKERRKVQDFAL